METSVSAPLANASGTMYSSLRVLLPPYARPLFTSSRLAQTEAPPRWAVSRSSGCTGLGPKVNGWRGNSCSLMRRVWTTASGRDDRPEQRQHPVGDLGLEGDHRRAAGDAVVGEHAVDDSLQVGVGAGDHPAPHVARPRDGAGPEQLQDGRGGPAAGGG